MVVIAISRTGHATCYGPFKNAAEAQTWADEHLPGWPELTAGNDPRGTWQRAFDAFRAAN